MSIFQALLMGLLQGLTEFLPVSSSGHLVLFTRITGIRSSLYFDLMLHLGSLSAVLIAERAAVGELVRHPMSKKSLCLLIASVATAAVVLPLSSLISASFTGNALPISFLMTALILTVANGFSCKLGKPLSPVKALVLGIAQGLAAFPGISRSGTTYSAGRILGLDDRENLSFCFLLSVPVILGGVLLSSFTEQAEAVVFLHLLVGFVAAFVSSLFALRLIKKAFSSRAMGAFSIYLTALSVFLTLNDLVLHLF